MDDNNLERALRRMQSRYGCRLSAATLGEDGVLAWDGKRLVHCAAYRVPVVDTTGAGDIFRAGFIYGLLQEWPLERQLDFSCAAAAMNCMAHGARGGIKPVDAIENTDGDGVALRECVRAAVVRLSSEGAFGQLRRGIPLETIYNWRAAGDRLFDEPWRSPAFTVRRHPWH